MLEAEQVRPAALAPQQPDSKVDPAPEPRPTRISSSPIRAPFKIVWRELRVRLLPVAGFILAGLFAILLWRQWVLVEASSEADPGFAQKRSLQQPAAGLADKATGLLPPLDTAATRN